MLFAVYLLGRVMFQFSTQSNFGWKAVGVALESSNCGITVVCFLLFEHKRLF